jgi:hypothetical protein
MARKFEARYPGRCPSCQHGIEVGDELIMEDEVAVHFDCAGEPTKRIRPREVCPRCFTEKSVSGACACEEPS